MPEHKPKITTATVRETPTGRHLHPIDLPDQLEDLFDSDNPKALRTRLIASKGKPDEYLSVRLGFFPPIHGSPPEIVYRTVHANDIIHTSVWA